MCPRRAGPIGAWGGRLELRGPDRPHRAASRAGSGTLTPFRGWDRPHRAASRAACRRRSRCPSRGVVGLARPWGRPFAERRQHRIPRAEPQSELLRRSPAAGPAAIEAAAEPACVRHRRPPLVEVWGQAPGACRRSSASSAAAQAPRGTGRPARRPARRGPSGRRSSAQRAGPSAWPVLAGMLPLDSRTAKGRRVPGRGIVDEAVMGSVTASPRRSGPPCCARRARPGRTRTGLSFRGTSPPSTHRRTPVRSRLRRWPSSRTAPFSALRPRRGGARPGRTRPRAGDPRACRRLPR